MNRPLTAPGKGWPPARSTSKPAPHRRVACAPQARRPVSAQGAPAVPQRSVPVQSFLSWNGVE